MRPTLLLSLSLPTHLPQELLQVAPGRRAAEDSRLGWHRHGCRSVSGTGDGNGAGAGSRRLRAFVGDALGCFALQEKGSRS